MTLQTKALVRKTTLELSDTLREQDSPAKADQQIVLIVDDEPLLARILDKFLTKAGLHTKSFTNPLEALEWYRSNHRNVGLVMLDIEMPGMSGVEFFQTCKRIDSDKKIAFMSSHNDGNLIGELLGQGADSYFAKPMDYDTVTNWALDSVSA